MLKSVGESVKEETSMTLSAQSESVFVSAAEIASQRANYRLFDLRSVSEFTSAHIAGAQRIEVNDLLQQENEIAKQTGIPVLVCRSGLRARLAYDQLGKPEAFKILKSGTSAWVAAGFPVNGHGRMSIERQTQLTIGLILLIASSLTVLVNPNFVYLTTFVGLGLLTAGLTGFCGLAKVIAKVNAVFFGSASIGTGATSCSV